MQVNSSFPSCSIVKPRNSKSGHLISHFLEVGGRCLLFNVKKMLLLRAFYIFECLQTSLLINAGKLNVMYFLAVCSASSSAVQQAFVSGVPQNESTLSLWIVKFKGKITLEHCYKFILIF